jgi:hypothetical protein
METGALRRVLRVKNSLISAMAGGFVYLSDSLMRAYFAKTLSLKRLLADVRPGPKGRKSETLLPPHESK